MERATPLRLYGVESDAEPLPWEWVVGQLEAAGSYWVTAEAEGRPRPRPVWGVWLEDHLHLSIGSPTVARQVAASPLVTVHLDSSTDVVLVEGDASVPADPPRQAALDAYNAKYDWDYDVAELGPFTIVRPDRVLAWRSAGWAGREGFARTGRWTFT